MGTLDLGRIVHIDLPDDVLAHVQAVIIAKLRVHEPILVGWTTPDGGHDEAAWARRFRVAFPYLVTGARLPAGGADAA